MDSLTLVGSYGRDYKNQKAVRNDWNAGKDFQIRTLFGGHSGQYISKSEAPENTSIFIRYNELRMIVQVQ